MSVRHDATGAPRAIVSRLFKYTRRRRERRPCSPRTSNHINRSTANVSPHHGSFFSAPCAPRLAARTSGRLSHVPAKGAILNETALLTPAVRLSPVLFGASLTSGQASSPQRCSPRSCLPSGSVESVGCTAGASLGSCHVTTCAQGPAIAHTSSSSCFLVTLPLGRSFKLFSPVCGAVPPVTSVAQGRVLPFPSIPRCEA